MLFLKYLINLFTFTESQTIIRPTNSEFFYNFNTHEQIVNTIGTFTCICAQPEHEYLSWICC